VNDVNVLYLRSYKEREDILDALSELRILVEGAHYVPVSHLCSDQIFHVAEGVPHHRNHVGDHSSLNVLFHLNGAYIYGHGSGNNENKE